MTAMHKRFEQCVARGVARCVAILAAAGLVGSLACGGDTNGPNPKTEQNLFFSFAFQYPALNLALTAPYDTVQLVAVPRNENGAVLTNPDGTPLAVQYVTGDTAVQVSPTGFVTAHSLTSGTRVVARLTIGTVTRTDTAFIQVTQDPLSAPLTSLAMQPKDLFWNDLTVGNLSNNGFFFLFPFSATIATGDPMTDSVCTVDGGCQSSLLVHYAVSDPGIATIDQYGELFPNRSGRVVVTLSTWAYGVGKVDSLSFSIGNYATEIKYFNVDSSRTPPIFFYGINGRARAPYAVGMILDVENYADESYLVTLPPPASGVRFIDSSYTTNTSAPGQVVDTLPSCAEDCGGNAIFVQFDSAGTFVVRYRGMRTGSVYADTLTILPYP